nr:unnamed protein product [Callosobruchus chinensis]
MNKIKFHISFISSNHPILALSVGPDLNNSEINVFVLHWLPFAELSQFYPHSNGLLSALVGIKVD